MYTTIIGLLCAAAAAIQLIVQAGASITDWKTWILPAALAALGYMAKDADAKKLLPVILLPMVLLFTGCQMDMGPTGKPTFRVDGVALAEYLNTWIERNDAKDSRVEVVATPQGQAIVAVAPDGKVTTEIINPSGVIVPNSVPVIK